MKRIFLLSFIFLIPQFIFSETYLHGIVWNSTNSQMVISDKIEIIQLTEEGMKPLQTFENQSEFRILLKNEFPYLIRVQYKNETYNEIINLNDLKNKTLLKKIHVYEITHQIDNLIINTGYQITKYSDGLEINKIYAIQNKTIPPRTISSEKLLFSLPENAEILQATITHEHTQMPIKLNLIKDEKGFYKLDKHIKPGNSEVLIQIKLSSYNFNSFVDPILLELQKRLNQERIMTVFMWRPEDAYPSLEGGEIKEKHVPNLGKAYLVYYDSNQIKVDFSKGSFLYKNPLKAYSNPIFDSPLKTILGIILGVFLIFLIIPIVATSGIRITKNA